MSDISRGERASALLRDPLLIEAFDTLEELYIDRFRNSAHDAAAVREQTYCMLTALSEVRQHLNSVVETGKLTAEQSKSLRF